MLEEFVNYVDSFYGQNDPLYPMMSRETKQPLTKFDIQRASENYLVMCLDEEDIEWCTLVREKVDSLMVSQINYENECG